MTAAPAFEVERPRRAAERGSRAPDTGGTLQSLGNGYLEARFGHDLSGVRVHRGPGATDAADSVGASAFTVGNDIVLGGSDPGPFVLAHELAHTLQQRGNAHASGPLAVSAPTDTSEREADAVAGAVMRDEPIPAITPREPHVARQRRPPSGTTTPNPAVATPQPAGTLTRAQFDAEVARRFACGDVHTGTLAEQQSIITRPGITPNPGLTAAMWHSWDPGPSSAAYQDIIDGVLAVAGSFGGIPTIGHIIFFEMYYELNASGVAVATSDVGASYGAGTLTVYKHGVDAPISSRQGVPSARSTAGGNYPNAPILTQSVTGETPGAPVGVPSQRESTMRVIEHELGHGLAEAAMSPVQGTPPDPAMIANYATAVGWFNGHLYDAGVAAVRTAIAAGTQPPRDVRDHPAAVERSRLARAARQPVLDRRRRGRGLRRSGDDVRDVADGAQSAVAPALRVHRRPQSAVATAAHRTATVSGPVAHKFIKEFNDVGNRGSPYQRSDSPTPNPPRYSCERQLRIEPARIFPPRDTSALAIPVTSRVHPTF